MADWPLPLATRVRFNDGPHVGRFARVVAIRGDVCVFHFDDIAGRPVLGTTTDTIVGGHMEKGDPFEVVALTEWRPHIGARVYLTQTGKPGVVTSHEPDGSMTIDTVDGEFTAYARREFGIDRRRHE